MRWLRIAVVVVALGALVAYVLWRRARVMAFEAEAPSMELAPGGRDARGGMASTPGEEHGPEGAPDDGPRDGLDPGGPRPGEGTSYGVEEGVPDPEGQPGTMGPRVGTVCLRRDGTAPGAASREVAGELEVVGNVRAGQQGANVVLAVDTPIERWSAVDHVTVYAQSLSREPTYALQLAAPASGVWLCAVRTADHQDFAAVHLGGCASQPDAGRIEMAQLQESLELIGFGALAADLPWPAAQLRRVSGTAAVRGAGTSRALLAVARYPAMDMPEREENPSAIAVTGADGRFEIRLLAAPAEDLWVCGLGFPPAGESIADKAELAGVGCTQVEVPDSAGAEWAIAGVRLTLDPDRRVKLTAHERQHYDRLSRCLSP